MNTIENKTAIKRVLITGGTGFVGSKFFDLLRNRGLEIVRFDLLPPSDNTKFVKGDVRDKAAIDAAIAGVDAVVHLAAAHHDFGISAKTFYDVNVQGMQNVCDSMQKHGVRNLCFYSTVAIYGSQEFPNEETPPAPESEYGKTKLAAEAVCRQWCETDPKNQCLTIRPTVIFGTNNFANMYFLIQQIDSGKFLRVGEMTNVKSLAYVDNIVNTTLELWLDQQNQRAGYEYFNYVDQPDLTSWDIAQAVYDGLGKKPSSISVPYMLARLLVIPFDIVIALTGKNLPVSSARIRKLAKSQTQFDASKIHAISKSNKAPIPKGISEMATWFRDHGKIAPYPNRRPSEDVAE